MTKFFQNIKATIAKEIRAYRKIYLFLAVILLTALFVRIYRIEDLLGFYYDQGRDALVIWRLWHEGRPFLIGPVTGLAGIFLGPFYYYLIAPFYLLSAGSPVLPAAFLAFLSVCGVFMLYFLGLKFQGRPTGLIAATIGGLSYYLILAGRWLSNPTPILVTSMLLVWAMWELLTTKKSIWWLPIFLLVGISLQMESASAVFYLPVLALFGLWHYLRNSNSTEKLFVLLAKDRNYLLLGVGLFLATLMPQVLFNIRHDNLIVTNFKRVLVEEKSFRLDFLKVLETRLTYFWNVFSSKIFMERKDLAVVFTLFSVVGLVSKAKDKKAFLPIKLLLLFISVPMIGYIFFQGNFGNIYDYYMTGYYLPLVLVFSLGLGIIWQKFVGKVVVVLFLILFVSMNVRATKNYLSAGVDGPHHITLGNQLQSVRWLYDDAQDLEKFKVDVYVPPVIPHSFDYLFLWQGTKKCGSNLCGLVKDGETDTIYTLYEIDPPHPERLEAWLARFTDWTEIEKEISFGGVTVQRRKVL